MSGHVQCPGVKRRQGSEPFHVDENQKEEGTGPVIKEEGKKTRQGARRKGAKAKSQRTLD